MIQIFEHDLMHYNNKYAPDKINIERERESPCLSVYFISKLIERYKKHVTVHLQYYY